MKTQKNHIISTNNVIFYSVFTMGAGVVTFLAPFQFGIIQILLVRRLPIFS